MNEIPLSETTIKIGIDGKISVSVTASELSYALGRYIVQQVGEIDDAGCDWTTTSDGRSCVNGQVEWPISEDPNIAALIDAANILRVGRPLKAVLYEEELSSELAEAVLAAYSRDGEFNYHSATHSTVELRELALRALGRKED